MSHPISCIQTSVQRHHVRFPRNPQPPRMKLWRCNLTAFAPESNLYMVANGIDIYVYQPTFPNQAASHERLALIIRTPVTSLDLKGTIDPNTPHSINRIAVEFLGQEEIAIVVCDDGDAIGYRVVDIQREIDQRQGEGLSRIDPILNPAKLRVLLHRNVGLSAWGIAVHREARLIAISSNTHNVTVFAFALTPHSGARTSTWFAEADDADFPYPRQRDHVITLHGTHNIPSVSFNNTGTDKSGRWLYSSAIDGRTQLWDLHSPQVPVKTFEIGRCAGTDSQLEVPRQCSCLDSRSVPHAAWATLVLDPTCFHDTSSYKEAFGTREDFKIPTTIADISCSKSAYTTLACDGVLMYSPSIVLGESSEDSGTGMAYSDVDEATNNDGSDNETEHSDDDAMEVDDVEAAPAVITPSANSALQMPMEFEDDESDESDLSPNEWLVEFPSDVTSTTTIYPFAGGNVPLAPQTKRWYFQASPGHEGLNLLQNDPIIIVTKEEIALLQPYRTYPIIAFHNPIFNNTFNPFMQDPNRHCFVEQIMELGIFIVASPGGKAGVFRLTKLEDEGVDQPLYSFRMDYLLGLPERLDGIAVAPVQDPPVEENESNEEDGRTRNRKWRFLMYYHDHKILSYEFSRRTLDRAPSLEDLVV